MSSRRLYKRAMTVASLAPTKMQCASDTHSGFHWFSYERGYGDAQAYGAHIGTYKCKRPLRLLDIGDASVRNKILALCKERMTQAAYAQAKNALHGDEQYAGSASNVKAHRIFQQMAPFVGDGRWDGTRIENPEGLLPENDPLGDINEIVLWVNPISSVLRCVRRQVEVSGN